MKTVCIAGVGLIGGSFALALRQAGFSGRIIGVSSAETVKKALTMGVIDQALPLEEAGPLSDLIYLAQPIRRILETIGELDAFVRPGTLITDAGSTKGQIVALAAEKIRRGKFIGGHPMAGKETRGVEGADANLFRGRPYILTSREPKLEEWILAIGARLVFLDADAHDRAVAVSSHVPQLASTALAEMIGGSPVAGPGAIDMTRLAMSAYDIWQDILATNAGAIEQALGEYIAQLETLRAGLGTPEMARHFAAGAAAAQALRGS